MADPRKEIVRDRRGKPVQALLLDLLMATMDSMSVWAAAADDWTIGLAWRDAVTQRMTQSRRYVPYDSVVADSARDLGLAAEAPRRLRDAWSQMRPWPDAAVVRQAPVPYAFVTNCSKELGLLAAVRSGLEPAFTLSAEEAGWYKPSPEIYRLACERVGADPVDVAFVAGAPYDARGASVAGLQTIFVERRRTAERLSPSVIRVPDLREALVAIRRAAAPEC